MAEVARQVSKGAAAELVTLVADTVQLLSEIRRRHQVLAGGALTVAAEGELAQLVARRDELHRKIGVHVVQELAAGRVVCMQPRRSA